MKFIVRNFGNRVKCIQANDPQKGTFISVNPDVTSQNAVSHLGLRCLPQLTLLVIVADENLEDKLIYESGPWAKKNKQVFLRPLS